jgi:hypothetical protein
MEWLIIIGALEYVRERTNHVVIYICLGISVFSLVAFIQVPIQIFVQKKYKKGLGKVLAYIFAFILIFIIYKFIYVVVEDLSALNIK